MYERGAVEAAVHDLDRLCVEEYRCSLIDLLSGADEELAARRLRRLTGIVLKRDFADSEPIGSHPTETGAYRRWIWRKAVLDGTISEPANPNFVVLDQLREQLPLLIPEYPHRQATWPDLVDEAQHESGLFRVLVRWVDDKLHGRQHKSFREYYVGEQTLNVGTIADVIETVFNSAMAPVFAAFIPGAGLAVPLLLIGARYGLIKMLQAHPERDDQN
jgi:hypothetical protein